MWFPACEFPSVNLFFLHVDSVPSVFPGSKYPFIVVAYLRPINLYFPRRLLESESLFFCIRLLPVVSLSSHSAPAAIIFQTPIIYLQGMDFFVFLISSWFNQCLLATSFYI